MSDIKITDNTKIFLSALDRALENGLEAIGMTAETYAKKEISRPKASIKSLVLFCFGAHTWDSEPTLAV